MTWSRRSARCASGAHASPCSSTTRITARSARPRESRSAIAQSRASGPVGFYDIDTPVTLAALERSACDYLSAELIPGYAVYLSFTGGPTLDRLERQYGSPAARPLYGSVDADRYRPLDRPAR